MLAVALVMMLGGVALAPDEPATPPVDQRPPPAAPLRRNPGSAWWSVAPILAAIAAWTERSHETGEYVKIPESAASLAPPPDSVVVFVPGHGNGPEIFSVMIDLMGLDPSQVEMFDYGWAGGDPDPWSSAQTVSTADTADALSGFVHGVATSGRPIYLVGFSKGGAAIAQLIAEWDAAPSLAPTTVTGAAILDPPMATGFHGFAQSVGRWVGPIPDDGGYDPVECDFWGVDCHDTRDSLGVASGVEVVVFRNPMSGISNFGDEPEDLRIIDVPDKGPFPSNLLLSPGDSLARAKQAHDAVTHSPVVAACVVRELNSPGSCEVDDPVYPSLGVVGGGLGGGQVGNHFV